MASRKTEVVIPLDLRLSQDQISYLASMVKSDETDVRRAQIVAASIIAKQADGGLMLSVEEVAAITASTGVEPACGADLLPFIAKGAGREGGCRIVKAKVDPSLEPALQDIASARGSDIDAIVTETLQVALLNGWYEQLPYSPDQILMSKTDQDDIRELLGGKFSTGTELAELIRGALSTDSNLFASGPEEAIELPV